MNPQDARLSNERLREMLSIWTKRSRKARQGHGVNIVEAEMVTILTELLARRSPVTDLGDVVPYVNIDGERFVRLSDHLASALPHKPESHAGGVVVKALEWKEERPGSSHMWASTEVGKYTINVYAGMRGGFQLNRAHQVPAEYFYTEQEAKAAAQADYETRILSSITLSPAGGGDEAVAPDEEDLASDGRWNAGVNYAIERLCEIFGIDPKSINWDAATETLNGDVMSVLCNVLVAAYGEEWSSQDRDTATIRAALEPAPATQALVDDCQVLIDNCMHEDVDVAANLDAVMKNVRTLATLSQPNTHEGESEAAAIEIADAVIAWMVKYDLLDADQEYRDDDIVEVLNDLAPRPETVVTEAHVEAAAKAAYDTDFRGGAWAEWHEIDEDEPANKRLKDQYRAYARAALAALKKEG